MIPKPINESTILTIQTFLAVGDCRLYVSVLLDQKNMLPPKKNRLGMLDVNLVQS